MLQGNIDAEAQARAAADNTLQSNIDAEAQARAAADNTLQSNIDAEEQARRHADNELQTAINLLLPADMDNLQDLPDLLAAKAPAEAELAAETGAGTDVTTPAVASNTVKTILQTIWGKIRQVVNVIAGEAQTRAAADTMLQSNIDAEAQTRAAADTTLQDNIDAKLDKNAAITAATKTKITYDSKGLVTAGADLAAGDIPDLDTAKITSGAFADARIASAAKWNGKVTANAAITGATKTKITYDSKGLVTAGADLTKSDIGLGNVTNDAQVKRTEMGAAGGVATLGNNGKVPSAQLTDNSFTLSQLVYVIEGSNRTGSAHITYDIIQSGTYADEAILANTFAAAFEHVSTLKVVNAAGSMKSPNVRPIAHVEIVRESAGYGNISHVYVYTYNDVGKLAIEQLTSLDSVKRYARRII
jgi:hypothetical protein